MALDHQRKRVQFQRPPERLVRFGGALPQSKEQSLKMPCLCQTWVHRESALKFRQSGIPLPVIDVVNPAERQVSLRATVIKGDGPLGCGSRPCPYAARREWPPQLF